MARLPIVNRNTCGRLLPLQCKVPFQAQVVETVGEPEQLQPGIGRLLFWHLFFNHIPSSLSWIFSSIDSCRFRVLVGAEDPCFAGGNILLALQAVFLLLPE
jgi:hypothetical protein